MEGSKKFQEMGQKLKAEVAAKEELELANKEAVVNQLAQIQGNADLAKMYGESASIGADNLSGNAPYLKVHSAGKSSKNFLADGKKPNDGWFFYAPTQEQWETVTCHILTISKGFKAEGVNEKDGEKEMKFNQIIAGVITNDNDMKPFLMYLTGIKLSPMWEFGKEASRYTKAKPFGIPMFALTVHIATKEQKTDYGFSWTLDFSIEKEDAGTPKLVLDPGEFQFLKESALDMESTIERLIANKTKDTANGTPQPLHVIDDEGIPLSEPTPF